LHSALRWRSAIDTKRFDVFDVLYVHEARTS